MSKGRVSLCVILSIMLVVVPVAMAQEKVEISLWHHWDEHRLELLQKMLDDFEAEYPWISVQSLVSSTAGAQDRMGTLLISGAAPEVMMVRGTYAFTFMSAGGFLPLNELLARDGIDLEMYNEGDLRTFQLLGETYALPFMSGSAWTNLMFYNKDMMTRSGLDPDSPPATWAQWREAARAMTRLDADGRAYEGGTTIPGLADVASWSGATLWSDDWRQARVSGSAIDETLDFMGQLLGDTYGTLASANTFTRANTCWVGLTGLCFTNNSAFSFVQTVDNDWGVSVAPVNERNPDAQPVGLVSSSWAYGIPSSISDDKLEAAWLLLKWLATEEDGAGWFARVQGRPSPVIEFNRHPDYSWDNPNWGVIIEAIQHDIAVPPVNAVNVINEGGSRALQGTVHRAQALADANRNLQHALDEYWETVDGN